MDWVNILIAFFPVPLFYFIYFRYFTFRPEYIKHLEGFFSGIALALILIIITPYIFITINSTHPVVTAFLRAAVPEKIGTFIILIILLRYYPNFSIMESILSAIMLGIGFSAVENIFYAANYGFSIIIIRIIFSVTLHITTCGIMGYYLGMRRAITSRHLRLWFAFKGLAVPLVLHGLFDTLLLMGGHSAYLTSPMILLMVIILEFLLARSQTMLPTEVVNAMGIRFEDWLLILRQPRYERWIYHSMGTSKTEPVHLFLWRPGLLQLFLVILFIVAALAGLSARTELTGALSLTLRPDEQILLFGIFPVSISIILVLVGAINPNFFKSSEIKIPIITDMVTGNRTAEFNETFVTFDITTTGCFVRTSEPLGLNSEIAFHFECPGFSSGELSGRIIWENHTPTFSATGTVIKLQSPPMKYFLGFMARYHLFRLRKGIVFLLKLPGFEATRRFFMRPITTMQNIKIYKKGSCIFSEGDSGTEFYLLKKGEIVFYKEKETGDKIIMGNISDEELFGEMSIIGNKKRSTTAECLEDCVVAVADSENLTALIKYNPEFSLALIKKLALRLETSESILFEDIRYLEEQKKENQKLLHTTLLMLLLSLGHNPGDDHLVPVDLKKISNALRNIDDETLSELMEIVMTRKEIDKIMETHFFKDILS